MIETRYSAGVSGATVSEISFSPAEEELSSGSGALGSHPGPDAAGDSRVSFQHESNPSVMSDYWHFFRGEVPLLTYGLSFTFFSSFGQTFLISLFVPYLLVEFSLTTGEFGGYYAAATLGSALLLPWAGQWLDRSRLTRFSLAVVALMALSALLLSIAWHLAVLCVALLGLRLAGQGLSSQAALTAMARYYGARRGKALSISSLGYPMGEAALPLLVAGSIALIGWRQSWTLMGVLAVAVFAPLLVLTLTRSGVELDPRKAGHRKDSEEGKAGRASTSEAVGGEAWSRREVVRDPRFWFALPAVLLPPFWVTGLLLYQTSIADLKGWSIGLMASAFVAFAVTRIIFSLATGGTVDRLSARQLFPFCVLPLGAGMSFLLLFGGAWVAFALMACLGVTMGMSGTVKAALWAELYGTRHLGAIKSMMTALMVLSTAGSPIVVGLVLSGGRGLDGLLAGGLVSVLIGSMLALRVLPGSRSSPVEVARG